MSIILTILMIAFGITSVVLLKSSSQAAWKKPLVGLFAILTLALAIGKMTMGTKSHTEKYLAMHQQYQDALASQVSQDLLSRHPKARVVILTSPEFDVPEGGDGFRNTILIDSLQQRLSDQGATVTLQALEIPEDVKAQYSAEPGMDAEEGMMEMMLMDSSIWFDSQTLNNLLQSLAPSADLLICTVDMVMMEETPTLPPAGEGPGLVLLSGWMDNVSELLKTTCLDSIVLHQNNPEAWTSKTKVPLDPTEAFNQRYLLVTKDNVDSLAGKHSQL